MSELLYKFGLRLARIKYVRRAMEDRADLREFRKRPTFRIFAGMFLIGFSFVMCWPAIGVLGGIALHLKEPWIIAVGGPVLYVSSHLCYLAGMYLSGEKYIRIFVRWGMRCWAEKLLSYGGVKEGM